MKLAPKTHPIPTRASTFEASGKCILMPASPRPQPRDDASPGILPLLHGDDVNFGYVDIFCQIVIELLD
jgi:hypothetical protein